MRTLVVKPLVTVALCVMTPPVFLWALIKELRFAATLAWGDSFAPTISAIKDIWKA